MYGEYLVNAQGEDVVAGIRTPQPVEEMATRLPEAYEQLLETMARLEQHYRDMQDIEFTVEEGRLYLLQTRVGEAHGRGRAEGGGRHGGRGADQPRGGDLAHRPGQLDQLLHPMLDPKAEFEVAARGLNASPGRGLRRRSCFDADTAVERGKAGESVILVRWETTPDDIHGMIAAKGVLTAHGGMTSHAAVVARGWASRASRAARPRDRPRREDGARSAATTLHEGDVITIDGGTGHVIIGEVPLVAAADQRGLRDGARLGRRAAPPEGAGERRQPRRRARRRASSARRASGSAAPSTCSSATSGRRWCRR